MAIGRHLAAYRLVAPDPQALAGAIAALLTRDVETAAADAMAASADMRARMDARPWAQRLMALYEQLMRARSPLGGRP